MPSFDVVIVGAGAAGLMCAMTAGGRGRRVLLLERGPEPGAKILISGGGRCNFTNLHTAADRFLSDNPHFCKSALSRYSQHDFIALIEKHRIAYHEKTLGQLFCDGSARQIVAMLLDECAAAGVVLQRSQRIASIDKSDGFRIATDGGTFDAPALVLASGGLSIPKMGASGFAHDLARRFGLGIVEPRPGLVPLTAGKDDLALIQPLAGLSFDAIVAHRRTAFHEKVLLTHRGLSGPAILQISSYWQNGESIGIDMLPNHDAALLLRERRRSRPKAEPQTVLAEFLPARLARALTERLLPNQPIGSLSDTQIDKAAAALKTWTFMLAGSEGYAKAEVTVGGVDTADLSSRTMEARKVPGLYVIGEAVDVTGWLGGYNFQWAWSSGWCAGMAV